MIAFERGHGRDGIDWVEWIGHPTPAQLAGLLEELDAVLALAHFPLVVDLRAALPPDDADLRMLGAWVDARAERVAALSDHVVFVSDGHAFRILLAAFVRARRFRGIPQVVRTPAEARAWAHGRAGLGAATAAANGPGVALRKVG